MRNPLRIYCARYLAVLRSRSFRLARARLPTGGRHEFGPALIKTPLVLLSDALGCHSWHAVIGIGQPQTHLIIIGIAPGTNALTSCRCVVPVLHIALLVQHATAGIPHGIVT